MLEGTHDGDFVFLGELAACEHARELADERARLRHAVRAVAVVGVGDELLVFAEEVVDIDIEEFGHRLVGRALAGVAEAGFVAVVCLAADAAAGGDGFLGKFSLRSELQKLLCEFHGGCSFHSLGLPV